MASYRIGIGSFNLKDGAVGIGTESTGLGNLKVEGTIKTTDLDVGVSTFTRYAGFEGEEARFDKDVSLSGEYSTTGDIVVEPGAILTVGLGSTACVGSVECISVKHHFSVPVGDTAGRNKSSGYLEGTVRYNRDLGTMEFFNGNEWRQFNYQSDTGNRGRGVFAGGRDSGSSNQTSINFFNIATIGNSQSFGDLATARMWAGGASNAIRGLFSSGTPTTNMDYITIASEGDGITFGTCNQTGGAGSLASSTRALFGGGYSNTVNAIQYVEIMTLGNSIDFGDLRSRTTFEYMAAASSTTRGFFMGSSNAGTNQSADVDVVTIASKGNSVKFGTLTQKRGQSASFANSTRAVQACGNNGPSASDTNTIDFISMSSGGNAIDFGDAQNSVSQLKTGAASQTRGCFAGGTTDGSDAVNTISFIQFSTTGNAQDFGDLSEGRRNGMGGLSDSHGGLGGF